MKHIQKISLVMVATVIMSGLFIGVFPKKASAALSIPDEYKIWRSYTLLADCVGSGGYTGKNEPSAQDTVNKLFDNGIKYQDGALYSRLVGNDKGAPYDCNTLDDVNKALKPLGFDDIYALTKYLGSAPLSQSKVKNKLQDRAVSKGTRLGLDSKLDVQFWFYDSVYRANLDNKGCSGILSNEYKSDRVSNIENGSTGFYQVSSSGEPTKFTKANYKVPVGDGLESVDQKFTKNNNNPTCGDIARNLTEARAKAYGKVVEKDPELNNPSNNSGNTNAEPTGDNIDFQCTFSNPLTSWFICPLIAGFGEAIEALDSEITKLLTIDTEEYFGDNQVGDNFKEVWQSIRTLSLIMLVIIGLIMVIGTAVEVGPFDAYTVKKVMPRLLIAVIVIALSWEIVIFLIEASNALAIGISALIQAPFKELGAVSFDGGQQSITAVAIIGLLLTLGPVGVLSFVATALLGVAIAFFVLVLREILVILLAIIAPVAIAAYILPNTQKAGKMWWDFFSKALLMFPIIAAFIATGRVFAVVASQGTGNDGNAGTLNGFIAFVAYFGPYFALPWTFKLAGGAIGQISGIVNDRSRGAFDRLKNYRKGQTASNIQKMKTGDRFQDRNAVTRQFNKRTSGIAGGWRKANFGFGARGEAYHDLHARDAANEAIKNNHLMQQLGYDDNGVAVMALSGGTAAGAARAADKLGLTGEARKRALATATSIGFNNSNATAALTLLAQNKSRALPNGQAGMELVRESAIDIAGGNDQLVENLMGGFAFNSRNAGRFDFGGEFTDGMNTSDALAKGWERATIGQHMQAFGASTQAFADGFSEDIINGSAGAKRQAAIALSEMANNLPAATADNQAIITEKLSSLGVDFDLTREEPVMQPDGTTKTVPVKVTVEEQLANIASGRAANQSSQNRNDYIITGSEIGTLGRQYSAATPLGQRSQDPNQQAPPDPNAP